MNSKNNNNNIEFQKRYDRTWQIYRSNIDGMSLCGIFLSFIGCNKQKQKELIAKQRVSRKVSEWQWITREFEIYERGHHLGARLWARVASDGLGREAIESPTEGAIPWPLLQLAVRVKVAPAILAPRQLISLRSVRGSLTILVHFREWSHRHAPWQPRIVLGPRIHWEPPHRRSHRHASLSLSAIFLFFWFSRETNGSTQSV